MAYDESPLYGTAPVGFIMAPIEPASACAGAALRVCLLMRLEPSQETGPYVLIRELPGARVYLGAICDAKARVQEWVEIWVQSAELRDLSFSESQERLSNHVFDARWRAEQALWEANAPDLTIVTGMEETNPRPVIIRHPAGPQNAPFAPVETTRWRLCQDDALLDSVGLPRYSTEPYRYLYDGEADGSKTFLPTSADAPVGAHTQSLDRLTGAPGVKEIFNSHCGLIRVTRFSPLGLEDYLRVLEGGIWEGAGPWGKGIFDRGLLRELQAWSGNQKGIPFLLHGAGNPAERLHEILYLKLSALWGIFRETRAYVKARQLPLLNLSPASFSVRLEDAGGQMPLFWSARCALVKPGQAHPLKITSTEQRYFVRLGGLEPSVFLPQGLGAHSFGRGTVRLRKVWKEGLDSLMDGTLDSEEYIGLDPHDLLWFKLPLGAQSLEFFAHVYVEEARGPRQARFRTVPTRLDDAVFRNLERAAGAPFPRSFYEVWPLLSSPCDLHSLGIIGIRLLLANDQSPLPEIVDDVLGLACLIGKDPTPEEKYLENLRSMLQDDARANDLLSPHLMGVRGLKPEQARQQMKASGSIWLETVGLLLRMFPGTGSHSFCKSYGHVSPLALETVFHQPMQELELLVLRLRSVIAPSLCPNHEIAEIIGQMMAEGR